MEKFILVERKKNIASKALQGGSVVLAIVALLLILLTWRPIFFLLAFVFGFLAIFFTRRYIEFEYSYFDGEVRLTKIINKSRRKKLAFYNMDEVVIIAPVGDRGVYNYENDSKLKVRDLTSKDPEANIYIMVAKGNKGMELIKFEPNEELLSEICKKYAQKVKR